VCITKRQLNIKIKLVIVRNFTIMHPSLQYSSRKTAINMMFTITLLLDRCKERDG
jgi:hypothetical protein